MDKSICETINEVEASRRRKLKSPLAAENEERNKKPREEERSAAVESLKNAENAEVIMKPRDLLKQQMREKNNQNNT